MMGLQFRAALANPRFRVVMLLWASAIVVFLSFPDPGGFGIDAHVYRNGLENMLAGRPAYLVPDPEATAISSGRGIYFFPPPPAAILGGAIVALPFGIGLLTLFGTAAIGLAYALMRRETPTIPEFRTAVGRRAALVLPLLGWFAFEASLQAILYGNQQSVLLLFAVIFTIGILRERPRWVGVGLGLSILLKPAPVLFLAPLIVARRWRDVGWTLAVAGVGGALSLLVVGVGPWVDFVHAVLTGANLVATQGYNMAPLAAWFPAIPQLAWVGFTGAGMAAAGRLPPRQMVVVSIAIFLLGWPVQWLHYATIALPAMALLLPDRRLRLALATSYILFQVYWRIAWLPAALILIAAALRPDLVGRVQDAIWRLLVGPGTATPPAPAAPRAPAAPG